MPAPQLMGSVAKRYCARGERCTQFEKLGSPTRLRETNKSEICEACQVVPPDVSTNKQNTFEAWCEASGKRALESRVGVEMENYKRELIISLWSKRGAFWDAVRQLRETWHVVPEVAVEARRKERLPLLPPILCDMRIPATEQQKEDWSRTYAQWSESLLDLATEVVPAPLQGFKIHGHERPIEWEGFMSVCVRFDPPG